MEDKSIETEEKLEDYTRKRSLCGPADKDTPWVPLTGKIIMYGTRNELILVRSDRIHGNTIEGLSIPYGCRVAVYTDEKFSVMPFVLTKEQTAFLEKMSALRMQEDIYEIREKKDDAESMSALSSCMQILHSEIYGESWENERDEFSGMLEANHSSGRYRKRWKEYWSEKGGFLIA